MKIPRSFKIKGTTWKVKKKKYLLDDDGNECHGLCHFDLNEIHIEKGLDLKKELEIYIHEWLHAYFHEIHLELDRKLEELIVEGLTKELLINFEMKP